MKPLSKSEERCSLSSSTPILWFISLGLYIVIIFLMICLYNPVPSEDILLQYKWCEKYNITLSDYINFRLKDIEVQRSKVYIKHQQFWPKGDGCYAVQMIISKDEGYKSMEDHGQTIHCVISFMFAVLFLLAPPTLAIYIVQSYI